MTGRVIEDFDKMVSVSRLCRLLAGVAVEPLRG